MSRAKKRREPLSPARVHHAAMALADARGIEAVTMRAVAEALGVEAMSLYKHVASKDALLDGLVEQVIAEIALPTDDLGWKATLRARAITTRSVLLRHPWAAMLIESRVAPGPARLRLHDSGLRALREGGFSIGRAYHAYLTLDSYVYGFVMQEVWWPFAPEERADVAESVAPVITPGAYPHLVEVMGFVTDRSRALAGASREAAYAEEFTVGLDLVLDGLERLRSA